MSLSERLTTMEEYQPWSREASPDSRHRKMSFNPVGTWTEPAFEQPVAAFEVPKWKRMLQVFLAVIYCLLAAGVVFGYAAIKPVLIAEQVYRDQCTKDELDADVPLCYQQDLRLNLMFTIAAVSTNVAALPVGTILDRFGPRVSSIIGAISLAAGALLLAFASKLPFDGYIPGYLFLALGGPFVFIPSFQLSNTFPQYSGSILALLTGAFDSSSAMFLIYRLIYQATDGDFKLSKFFLAYLVVPVYILVVQVLLMPATSYKTVGELVTQAEESHEVIHESDDEAEDEAIIGRLQEARRAHRDSIVSEVTELLGTKDGAAQTKEEEVKKNISGVWGALHGRTAAEQVRTPWFILITLFTVLQMLRINYFVATIRSQYIEMLGYEKGVAVNDFFDFALPIGGVISIPFIGLVLDRTSTVTTLSVLVIVATTIGVLGVIPQLWAAYANVSLLVLYRPFYYTAVSDYAAKVFGFATFGKVYGLVICLAGLFNFAQSALDALTHRTFANDPIPVNLLLLSAALLVGIALVAFVARRSGKILRENIEAQAEGATERLMPGADLRGVGVGVSDYGAIEFHPQDGENGSPREESPRGRRRE
ncbi:MFS general substrate transporter [Aaosphaeria arxii CBS 175.79]|uniref:MFS general substrate transporter n=1 Tax=Aaosphaeria arxii CBS 175.79 TaxID=1450172 RepID=A0A6A5XYK4_9PLEO|nr:MFS general substrate transporter [Aaosphaeria arxii CBS 175.79]KAF2018013.1 MFS general substrate transporter [Aaosphaeria arxii CBS 175.79]